MIGAAIRGAWASALGILVMLGAVACSTESPAGAAPRVPRDTTPVVVPPLEVSGWVSATDGTMPLIIVAPHGGDLSPTELPDRTCTGCVVANDLNTRELALAIENAFASRIGKRPFVVANRLHRRKYDANRAEGEATGNYAPLAPFFALFHARVDSAKARALRVHPRALLIDLHGHAHAIARLELGYLLSEGQLRLADSLLAPYVRTASSIARLDSAAVSRDAGATLLRGPRALGTRLAAAGVPSVPSASDPAPASADPYFDGGYNTQRHGSLLGGPVDAIQLESHYVGIRDSATSRAAFAEVFVTAMLQFLADHYGWSPT